MRISDWSSDVCSSDLILREESPAFARVGSAVPDTQRIERNALRIEHPEYIMIGMEQQLRRIADGRVAREPAGIGMPVRADDRQARHLFIAPARDRKSAA